VSLPTAVASGVEAAPSDRIVPVRPVRVAVGAALLAALYLVLHYVVHPVPARFVKLAGGRGDAFARTGGVRIVWEPPPGFDLGRIGDKLAEHGTHVTRDGNRAVIELGGVSPDDAQAVVQALTQEPLQFHAVVEAPEMQSLIKVLDLPGKGQQPVDFDVLQWRPEGRSDTFTDYTLRGRTRADLEQAFALARSRGWTLPAGEHVAYEHVINAESRSHPEYWMSFIVLDEIGLDGDDVESAVGRYDPNTNRPVVSVDLTRAGAEKFGDLTARITGHKLAIMTGNTVRSAPIINEAIRGGRAVISMGASDPSTAEHERDVLVKVLRAGVLPVGGTVISQELVAPRDGARQLWLARLLLGLGGGALVGLLVWMIVRITRPVRRRAPPRAIGPIPVSRIVVTLLAPAAVLALSYIPVPALDSAAITHVMRRPAREVLNLGSIGLTPLVTAYLIAGAVRAVFRGRDLNRHLVVILTIVFTAVQAWFLTAYLQSFPLDDLMPRTAIARVEVLLAFGAATAFLAGIAAVIRNHGLGNGYAALVAGGWFIMIARYASLLPLVTLAAFVLQILALVVPVMVVLRWRVYGAGEGALRVPTSGMLPVAHAGGIFLLMGVLTWIDLGSVTSTLVDVSMAFKTSTALALGLSAGLVVVYSLVFAWPRAVSWAIWGRAALLSIALAIAVAGVIAVGMPARLLADPVIVALVGAFLLDAYDDLRARRIELERVWCVHSAQDAERIERTLHDAGIPCHLACSHVRTALGGFGAFSPVDVLVTAEHAPAARTLLS
jgi:hypothetical protein